MRPFESVLCLAGCLLVCGCQPEQQGDDPAQTALTASRVRAARRAYDGAPPVIPHPSHNAECTTCHNRTGREVPNLGFAPANPHDGTRDMALTQNCRQCHVFRQTEELFAKNTFVGLPQELVLAAAAYPGAAPVIPHSRRMRENCLACHSGPASRPEIRCTHTDRANCRQCHVDG